MVTALLAAITTFEATMASGGLLERLVLGRLNDNTQKYVDPTTPTAANFKVELSSVSLTSIEKSALPTSNDMINAMGSGQTHLSFNTSFGHTFMAERTNKTALLGRWKHGDGAQSALVAMPPKSEIKAIDDPASHRIGFQYTYTTFRAILSPGLARTRGLERVTASNSTPGPKGYPIGNVGTDDDKKSPLWRAKPDKDHVPTRNVNVPRQIFVRGWGHVLLGVAVVFDLIRAQFDSLRAQQLIN